MDSARPTPPAQELLALAEKKNTEYMSMIMAAPLGMTLLRGKDLVVEIANQPMLDIWNHSREEVIGRRLLDIFPELTDQPFPRLLANVFHTGNSLKIPEMEAEIVSPHGNKHIYIDFCYNPLFDQTGKVTAIMASVVDITELVLSRKKLEENEQEQQALNEELTAINEELASSNEELISSQDSLEQHINSLAESESRFRSLVAQAPVGICMISAPDLRVLEVNESYLELVGKQRSQLERLSIWEAIPEAAANYAPVLNEVIRSGNAFVANEHELTLIRHGVPEQVFVDFVYEPVKDISGRVNGVMVVAIDITAQVLARRSIADVEERIRLAVEAAEIGTYEHDLLNDELRASERYYEIFGFDHAVHRNELVLMIHPDDQAMATRQREESYQTGKLFYEARFILSDGTVKWIRAQGNVYHDDDHRPMKVLGTILDITEFKRLQQQKDDFISIASHELKTPITTLKASLQLLERLKHKPDNTLLPKLIEQSNRSMNKISELVEDLLNVSRMNEGEIRLDKTTFKISDILNECCNHIRVSGTHELIFEGDEELEVRADEHRIDQVIVNFVNNAVKYAPDSPLIYLLAERRGNMAWVAVKDLGSGIPFEKQALLFDRYYRADSSGVQVSGLGLGLYISAEIINRHKGQIGVESEPGKGSTFWFTLPLEG